MPHAIEHLDEAALALRARDHEGATRALLDAWRAVRAPSIADALDRLSERIELPGLAPKPAQHLREAWFDIATRGREVDVPRLLQALPLRPFGDVQLRVGRMLPRGPDPRVGLALARLLAARAMNSTIGTTTWNQLFTMMEQSADARMRPFLETSLAAPVPGDFGKQLERGARRVLAALPNPVPALDPALAEKLAAVLESIAGLPVVTTVPDAAPRATRSTGTDEASLLSAIYEEPDEDGPRLVYADWAAERGDPRGELIHLQFKERDGRATEKERKRIATLLRKHMTQWLGPIEPAIIRQNLEFERGFLSRCAVVFPTPEIEARLTDHPAWSTVSLLWNTETNHAFLLGCHLRGLRVLPREIPLAFFAKMAIRERPYGIEDIRVMIDGVSEVDRSAIAALPAFPRLRAIRLQRSSSDRPVRPADVPWLFDGVLPSRIQSIQPADADPRDWLPALDSLPKVRRISFGVGYWAELVREEGAACWTIELHWANEEIFRNDVLGMIDAWLVPMRSRFDSIRLKRYEGATRGDDLHAVADELRKRIARVDVEADASGR